MSNSATGIFDPVVANLQGKELKVNEFMDAAYPATLFGRRASLCGGLTWGFYGGTIVGDGVLTQVYLSTSNTLTLTASATNYIEATRAGVVSKNTTGFTPGRIPLYEIAAGASTVTSYIDYRAWAQPQDMTSKASIAVTGADVTLSAAQARCGYLTITGVLTGNRNVIVPNDWEGIVFCNNAGAFTTTIKTASGSGVVVAQTKRACLLADGTNVVRVTADI